MRVLAPLVLVLFSVPNAVLGHLQILGSELHIDLQPDRLAARVEFIPIEIPFEQGIEDINEADVRAYADFFLSHVRITVNDTKLEGRVLSIRMPDNAWSTKTCEMEFLFPSGGRRPEEGSATKLQIRQFLLEDRPDLIELTVAEIVYVVRVRSGNRVLAEGPGLTENEPFVMELAWPGREAVEAKQTTLPAEGIASAYIRIGIQHILGGSDHLLFVAALVLAAASLWDLIKVVTVFTIAHTLTICLSALDIVRLPGYVVEPFIAASIVVVAVQNLFWPRQSHGAPRLAMAFLFGLFHGLGFAGGLLTAMQGMPNETVLTAIAAFSLGVEIGNQILVLPLFALLAVTRRWEARRGLTILLSGWLCRVGGALIALAGMVYFVAAVQLGIRLSGIVR